MNVFYKLYQLNQNFSRKIFRHEVESSLFNNKKFSLPKVPPVTEENLEIYKKNFPFNYYYTPDEKNSAAEALLMAEAAEHIIGEAEKIRNNIYDIINSGDIWLGEEINWHLDYKSKYKWHEVLVWRENFFRFPEGADIKYPWEVARFHQGLILAKAYLITGEEKYCTKFLALFNSFIEKNPFCIGVNWAASEEVSLRLVNVIFSFAVFINCNAVNPGILNRLHEFILQHTVFIENNLLYPRHRGHEYLSNMLALAMSGLVFKSHSYGIKNIQRAYSGFEQEIRSQVYHDGVTYLQSLHYHVFAAEHFLTGKIILEKAGVQFSSDYNKKLKCVFHVYNEYLREDNSIPQIGDALSSRAIGFSSTGTVKDFSYILAAGKYMFKEGKYKSTDTGISDIIFLYGPAAVDEYKRIPVEEDLIRSSAFPKGGHYIIRSSNMHLFIEAGEIGKNGEGAPGHNDAFTFELYYKGGLFIADPGTYSFYANEQLRNYLRSVRAHNTFYIDNIQLAEFEGLFKIKGDITKPKLVSWETNNVEDILTVQHYAYTRLQDPVVCKRTFHMVKEKNMLLVKDEFLGGMTHEIISNLTFHPSINLERLSETRFSAESREGKLNISFSCSSQFFGATILEGQYSHGYGVIEKTKKINIILKDKFPVSLVTEIQLL